MLNQTKCVTVLCFLYVPAAKSKNMALKINIPKNMKIDSPLSSPRLRGWPRGKNLGKGQSHDSHSDSGVSNVNDTPVAAAAAHSERLQENSARSDSNVNSVESQSSGTVTAPGAKEQQAVESEHMLVQMNTETQNNANGVENSKGSNNMSHLLRRRGITRHVSSPTRLENYPGTVVSPTQKDLLLAVPSMSTSKRPASTSGTSTSQQTSPGSSVGYDQDTLQIVPVRNVETLDQSKDILLKPEVSIDTEHLTEVDLAASSSKETFLERGKQFYIDPSEAPEPSTSRSQSAINGTAEVKELVQDSLVDESCALKVIVQDFDGSVPDELNQLESAQQILTFGDLRRKEKGNRRSRSRSYVAPRKGKNKLLQRTNSMKIR